MSTEKTQEIVTRTVASFLAELDNVIGTSLEDQGQLEARVAAVQSLQDIVGRHLSDYSVRLHRRQNSVLPIYRLPVELLIDIFLRVIDLIDWDMEQNRTLASVCKHWYDVIVQSPQFWHRINVSHDLDVIKRIMRRNGDGPFSIQFDKDSIAETKHEEVLDLLAPHSLRWQSIMFQGRLTDSIFKLMSSPTPNLTELFVYQWSGEPQRKFELPEGKSLRRLDVGLVGVPWSSSRLSNLRSIQIRNITKELPSLADLSTILSSSPDLTWLRLSDWTETDTPPNETYDTIPRHPIRLPKLETLVLQSIQPRYVNHLLSYLHSSSCTCLILDDAPSKHLQGFDVPLVNLMTSAVSSATSLNLDLDETKLKLAITSTPEVNVLDKWIYWANRKPGIDVTIQLKNLTEMQVLAEAISGMELAKGKGDDVERSISVVITGRGQEPSSPINSEVPTPFPCEALDYLPLVKEIRCSNHFNATPLLQYLGRPQTNFDESIKWPCPKLTKLEVNTWDNSADTMFDQLKAFGEARQTAAGVRPTPPAAPATPATPATPEETVQDAPTGGTEAGDTSNASPAEATGAENTSPAANESPAGEASAAEDATAASNTGPTEAINAESPSTAEETSPTEDPAQDAMTGSGESGEASNPSSAETMSAENASSAERASPVADAGPAPDARLIEEATPTSNTSVAEATNAESPGTAKDAGPTEEPVQDAMAGSGESGEASNPSSAEATSVENTTSAEPPSPAADASPAPDAQLNEEATPTSNTGPEETRSAENKSPVEDVSPTVDAIPAEDTTATSSGSSSGSGSSVDGASSIEPEEPATELSKAGPSSSKPESVALPEESTVTPSEEPEKVLDEVETLEREMQKAREEEEKKNRPVKLERLSVPSDVVERLKVIDLLKGIVFEA
ncbi:hypothetical protein FRB90_010018 [Tulasnella sp. 427]|nr:hypothetical protein FRB90_010018 [Tulasnella sp. 427]